MNELFLVAVLIGNMTITSYRSVEAQTDSTPFITATGEHVHKDGVALSRDLLKRWGGPIDYGDIIYIEDYGFKVVNDCMGKTKYDKVNDRRVPINKSLDIWVATKEEEKAIGVKRKRAWLILGSVN